MVLSSLLLCLLNIVYLSRVQKLLLCLIIRHILSLPIRLLLKVSYHVLIAVPGLNASMGSRLILLVETRNVTRHLHVSSGFQDDLHNSLRYSDFYFVYFSTLVLEAPNILVRTLEQALYSFTGHCYMQNWLNLLVSFSVTHGPVQLCIRLHSSESSVTGL